MPTVILLMSYPWVKNHVERCCMNSLLAFHTARANSYMKSNPHGEWLRSAAVRNVFDLCSPASGGLLFMSVVVAALTIFLCVF